MKRHSLVSLVKAGERARNKIEKDYYRITKTPTHWSLSHLTIDELVSGIRKGLNSERCK